ISCPAPENLEVSSVTAESAVLTWDEEANASEGYTWYVYTAGDTPGEDTAVATATTALLTATANGLDSGTNYEAYVEADCDADGLSSLQGPVSFTTFFLTTAPWEATFNESNDTPEGITISGNWAIAEILRVPE